MRLWSLLMGMTLTGCQSVSLGLGPAVPSPAGGGGGPVASAQTACPVDAEQALDTAIAGVSDPVAGSLLQAQWQYMQVIAGGGSESALEDETRRFSALCASLADQGVLTPEQSDRLSGLARCYLGA